MQYSRGEVWLVDFDPSSGHEFKKTRPAVIIESDKQLGNTNLITIMPLTSNLANQRKDDILITQSSLNRLYTNSIIKTHHIASFDKDKRFIKKIGKLEPEYLNQIEIYLRFHFDL